MRSVNEIEEQIGKALDSTADHGTQWPGMTFEEGVDAALSWALGHIDEAPMDGDE